MINHDYLPHDSEKVDVTTSDNNEFITACADELAHKGYPSFIENGCLFTNIIASLIKISRTNSITSVECKPLVTECSLMNQFKDATPTEVIEQTLEWVRDFPF